MPIINVRQRLFSYLVFVVVFTPICIYLWRSNQYSVNIFCRDEYRIAVLFLKKWFEATSFQEALQTFFLPENENRPFVIRMIYVFSYWLTGSVNIKFVCVLANIEMLGFLYIIWDSLKRGGLSLWVFAPIPYLALNLSPVRSFYFAYESFFYIGSFFLPILIFHVAILGKRQWLPFLLLVVCLGVGAVSAITSLCLLIYSVAFKKVFHAVLYFLILLISYIILDDYVKDASSGTLSEILNNIKPLTLLTITFCGSFATVILKGNVLLIQGLGILIIILTLVLTITKFDIKNKNHHFLLLSFFFILGMIFLNTQRRWGTIYERYLQETIQGSKIIFSIAFVSISFANCMVALKEKSNTKSWMLLLKLWHGLNNFFGTNLKVQMSYSLKKATGYVGFSVVFLISVLIYLSSNLQFYADVRLFQKQLYSEIFNWQLSQTNPNDKEKLYLYLTRNKIFTPTESYSKDFIEQVKAVQKDTSAYNEKYPIEVTENLSSTLNMYGIYDKFVNINSDSYPSPKKVDKMNGVFLFLVGPNNTYMLPTTFKKQAIKRLITKFELHRKGFIMSVLSRDYPSGSYKLLVANIQDMKIVDYFYAKNQIRL